MILFIILILLLLLAILASVYIFKICFHATNEAPNDPYAKSNNPQFLEVEEKVYDNMRRMDEVPYETVSVKSFDGLTLRGHYYHLKDGAPVTIMFHGYRSTPLRDCALAFHLARKLGMNVLTVDQRAHGKSEGHVITLGIWERRDCLSWIRYINNRFGNDIPIILFGLSMGAATVIMATALPISDNVQCVIADCPYSSPSEILKALCREHKIPVKIVSPLISLAARVFGGFDINQASAVEAAGVSPVPILLLHGEEDFFVPCDMSAVIHEASNGCTRLATFLEAGHGLSYIINPKRYETAVFTFLKQFPALEGCFSSIENKANEEVNL